MTGRGGGIKLLAPSALDRTGHLSQLVGADAFERLLRRDMQPAEFKRCAAIGVLRVGARAVADQLLHGCGRALPCSEVQRSAAAAVHGSGTATIKEQHLDKGWTAWFELIQAARLRGRET